MSGLSSQDSVDNLYLEDDIVWSDDPNTAYFASVIERKVLKRMASGKKGDDSLVGNSTQEEIMGLPPRDCLEAQWIQMKNNTPPEQEIERPVATAMPEEITTPVDFPRLFDIKSTTTKSALTEHDNSAAPVLPTSPIRASMEPQPPEFIFFQHSGQAGYRPPPGIIDPKYIQERQRRRRKLRLLLAFLCLMFIGALVTVFVTVAKKARESTTSASALGASYTSAPSPLNTSQGITKKPLTTTRSPTFAPSKLGMRLPTPSTPTPTSAIVPATAPPSATSNPPVASTIAPTIAPTAKGAKTGPLQTTQAPTSLGTSATPSLRPTQAVTQSPSPQPFIATPAPVATPPPSALSTTKIPASPPTPPPVAATTAAPSATSTTSMLQQAKSFLLQSSPGSSNALSDTTSPQYKAMVWLSTDPYFIRRYNPKSLYRWALATLYYSTAGTTWTNSASWLSSSDECNWFSTAGNQNCNGAGYLADLGLNGNNLQGTIPPELSLLSSNLVRFDLGNNTLRASIPTELGLLSGLVSLQLSGNQLAGFLPTELGDMTSLLALELNDNQLSGPMPSQLGNMVNLEYLSLFGNQIHGTIPPTVGQLSLLQVLNVDMNVITGPMPSELGLLTNLQTLNAISNNMTGSVPSAVCKLHLSELQVDCTSMDCNCCNNCESYTTNTTVGGTTTWWHHWTYYGTPQTVISRNKNQN